MLDLVSGEEGYRIARGYPELETLPSNEFLLDYNGSYGGVLRQHVADVCAATGEGG